MPWRLDRFSKFHYESPQHHGLSLKERYIRPVGVGSRHVPYRRMPGDGINRYTFHERPEIITRRQL
jgi:hypothetical protein